MPEIAFELAKETFFDRKAVVDAVGKKTASAIRKTASGIRTRAKRSIRKARRKTLAQMDTDELIAYYAVSDARRGSISRKRFYALHHGLSEEQRKRYWGIYFDAKRTGRRPQKPFAPSKPGEAPRSRTGILKKHIYYYYSRQQQSAVIGSVKLSGKKGEAPGRLEHGGSVRVGPKIINTLARPYMEPALDAELPKLEQRLKG